MNIEALGNLGDFVGGVAVLITLIYLAFQVRHAADQARSNTEATEAATALDASRQFAGLVGRYTVDPNLQRIWDAVQSNGDLSLEDRRQFIWIMAETFHTAEGIFVQHQRGFVSDDVWGPYVRVMVGYLKTNVGEEWWLARGSPYSPTFYDYIDAIRTDPGKWGTWTFTPMGVETSEHQPPR